MGTPALIGLGSNLGDRKANLDLAITALRAEPGVTLRVVSRYHETHPVGGPAGQGAFLNAAALLTTTLDPFALLDRLQAVERASGRVRTVRWGERPLDLDLLTHGTRFLDTPELTLPHPRMAVRRFVLAPAVEVAPDLTHTPTRQTLRALLALLDRRPSYVALAGPPSPLRDEVFRRLMSTLSARGLRGERVETPEPAPPGWKSLADKTLRQCEALDVRVWTRELLGETWLVSDFCVGPGGPTRRGLPGVLFWRDAKALKRGREAATAERQRQEQLLKAYERALRPTFAVMIDPDAPPRPAPWPAPFPVLYPGTTDPGELLGEVVAACEATRAG